MPVVFRVHDLQNLQRGDFPLPCLIPQECMVCKVLWTQKAHQHVVSNVRHSLNNYTPDFSTMLPSAVFSAPGRWWETSSQSVHRPGSRTASRKLMYVCLSVCMQCMHPCIHASTHPRIGGCMDAWMNVWMYLMLCCVVLYCIILCCTILYYIISYYTTLYYSIVV